ncbi:HNH endonuclease [Salarchaeum sp. III]|uniref:HNH endonuclease signature motif containing protein n=1 Tax=Salarchaeum sp. III TaxID=3107927 RepID=UPI002EDA400F
MPDDATARDQAREKFWNRHGRGWRCPGCGRSRDEVGRVDVHHRDENPQNNDLSNLVALCKHCHLEGQHGRDVDDDHLQPPAPRGTSEPTPRNLTPP